MSSKHYFPLTAVNTLVPRALQALVATNPSLSLLEAPRVVYDNSHPPSRVTLVSGGGSGHEPAWAGYVGDGLLAAAACGDIFASPGTRQVLAAVAAAPSDRGTILLITNYTGDKLHFGLAAERALAAGLCRKIVVLPATDDVSIGRSNAEAVGRRGLAGNVITMKILGAAASHDYSFERCVEIGKAVNEQLASIGSALDHCHVPGRQNHETISDDVCVVGAGVHNEPGALKVSPFPSIEELIQRLLRLLCDPADTERAFVNFNVDDDIVLLVNNLGGLSNLELGALTHETLEQLRSQWGISPVNIYSGCFEASLNGPGFSITLFNMTLAASGSNTEVAELHRLLEAPTAAPAWPNVLANTSTRIARPPLVQIDLQKQAPIMEAEDIKVDPVILESAIRHACMRAVASEPDLTHWDMIMGDGDCGESVKAVCLEFLSRLDTGVAASGSLLSVLHCAIDCIDATMGGTLGAILGIFFSAFISNLRQSPSSSTSDSSYSAAVAAAPPSSLAATSTAAASTSTTSPPPISTPPSPPPPQHSDSSTDNTTTNTTTTNSSSSSSSNSNNLLAAETDSVYDSVHNSARARPAPRDAPLPVVPLLPRLASALCAACRALERHTAARVGDRTVMDALLPFAAALSATRDLGAAVAAAAAGAERTRRLRARFGRASYVGGGGDGTAAAAGDDDDGAGDSGGAGGGGGGAESGSRAPRVPDPGAWAVVQGLRGLEEGLAAC